MTVSDSDDFALDLNGKAQLIGWDCKLDMAVGIWISREDFSHGLNERYIVIVIESSKDFSVFTVLAMVSTNCRNCSPGSYCCLARQCNH